MLKKLKPEDIESLVVHCSATPSDMEIGVEDIDRWHRERGWRKVGYHYVITRSGVIQFGRCHNEVGAHARGHNTSSVGICLVGGVDSDQQPEENYTPEQYEALDVLLEVLVLAYPNATVLGHCDLPGVTKECPCFDVRGWYGQA